MSELDPIARFCSEASLPWDEERRRHMARYLDLLEEFNRSMNLIGPMDRPAIVEELLLDSLVAAAARPVKGSILDVGTGAGLPGIVLKIIYPEAPLTLVEPRQKRSTFLKIATHRLGLEEVTIFRGRIEEFDDELFDFVISKAFRPPLQWLETAAPYVADDGAMICMGRESNRQELTAKATELEFQLAGESSIGEPSPQRRVCFAFERR